MAFIIAVPFSYSGSVCADEHSAHLGHTPRASWYVSGFIAGVIPIGTEIRGYFWVRGCSQT